MLLNLNQKATLYGSKICMLRRYILHILHKRYALNEMDTSFQQLPTASESLQEHAHGLDVHGIYHRLHAHTSLQLYMCAGYTNTATASEQSSKC